MLEPNYFQWHSAVLRVMHDARRTGRPWSNQEVMTVISLALSKFNSTLRDLCWVKTSVWIYAEPAEIPRDPWFAEDLDEAVDDLIADFAGSIGYRWLVQ